MSKPLDSVSCLGCLQSLSQQLSHWITVDRIVMPPGMLLLGNLVVDIAVDGDDVFFSLVRALLKCGMRETTTVQLEMAYSISRHFKAVPRLDAYIRSCSQPRLLSTCRLGDSKVTNFTFKISSN